MIALASILSACAVLMMLLYVIRARTLRPSEARLSRIAARERVTVESGVDGGAVLKRRRSRAPLFSALLDRSLHARRWARDLERADAKLRASEYLLLRLVPAVLIAAAIALVGRSALTFLFALLAGLIVFMLPALWLRIRAKRRLGNVEGQLVETLTLIANALRSGFAFTQAMDVTAKRVGPPMATELSRALLDINLGASVENALTAMNERIDSDDVDIIVTAILIQRSAGGNLAEVLDNVSETIRDRERIRGEIKTMTTQQQFTGWVLSCWPATLALIFFAINPSTTSLLWTTGAGLVLLAIWGTLNAVGILAIRRILDIDI